MYIYTWEVNGHAAKWIRPGNEGPWIDPATSPPTSNKNRPAPGYTARRLVVLTNVVTSYIKLITTNKDGRPAVIAGQNAKKKIYICLGSSRHSMWQNRWY